MMQYKIHRQETLCSLNHASSYTYVGTNKMHIGILLDHLTYHDARFRKRKVC